MRSGQIATSATRPTAASRLRVSMRMPAPGWFSGGTLASRLRGPQARREQDPGEFMPGAEILGFSPQFAVLNRDKSVRKCVPPQFRHRKVMTPKVWLMRGEAIVCVTRRGVAACVRVPVRVCVRVGAPLFSEERHEYQSKNRRHRDRGGMCRWLCDFGLGIRLLPSKGAAAESTRPGRGRRHNRRLHHGFGRRPDLRVRREGRRAEVHDPEGVGRPQGQGPESAHDRGSDASRRHMRSRAFTIRPAKSAPVVVRAGG